MWAKAWAAAPLTAMVRADADAGHHVADLADDVIGENPADVVFDDGVTDAEDGHGRSHDGEDLKAGKSPGQHVNRRFGREGAQKDGAFHGRLRIGIGKPGMEGQHRGIQGKPGEDQVFRPGAALAGSDAVEDKTPRLVVIEHHPGKEEESAEDMEQGDSGIRPRWIFSPSGTR